MALLDEDSFSMSLDKSAQNLAGFVAKDPTQSAGYVTMTYVEEEGPEADKKPQGKPSELSIDVQKISSFSLRRKKDRDKVTRRSSKTPPDSPKTKVPDVPSGQTRKPSKGGGANVKATSSRKQYSTLMENEMSSGAEDEDDDNFLLSKGHVAREKRSSSHPTSKTIPQEDTPSSKNIINPSFLFYSPNLSNSLSSDITTGFPVRFTPPNEARFPESEFSTDNKTELQIGHMTDSDSHMIIPPPEAVSHVIIPSPSGGFSTDNISTLPVLPPPPQSHIPPLPPPPSQPTVPEITEESDWSVSEELHQKCTQQFYDLHPESGLLSGEKARDFFIQSRLPVDELSKIWKLSDIDHDGFLSLNEFVVAMKLVLMRRKKVDIPASLPDVLKPRPKSDSSPVISKIFLPPPPPGKPTPTEAHAETDSSGPLIPGLAPPRPPPPAFISSHQRSKTEPTIAISDAKPLLIEHVMVGDKPYAVVNVSNKTKKKEEDAPSLLPVDDVKDSKSETSLLSHASSETDSSLTTPPSASLEPVVARLISLEPGEDTTGDEDDTLALVTEGSLSNEGFPVPKPRKKKRSPQHKKDTVIGRVTQAPPPKPTPYQGKSSLHTTTLAPISSDSQELDTVTPSPPPADDLAPIINIIKRPFHKPINEELESTKGHGRSTSWDLTKMLREGTIDVHEDLPSAEPPKLPPRRNVGSPSSDDESRDKAPPPPTTTTLQRSASTGSLSSIGQPTTVTVQGSRSPSIESGSLVSAMELSGATPTDNLLARTSTMVIRRPAPRPPPTTKPKPKKQPLYPPNFKKINSPEANDPEPSMEEKPPLSLDLYQKKTKLELQKCVKELKEENDVYTKMNTELKNKLQELIEKRYRLEEKLKPYKTAHSSHAH